MAPISDRATKSQILPVFDSQGAVVTESQRGQTWTPSPGGALARERIGTIDDQGRFPSSQTQFAPSTGAAARQQDDSSIGGR